MLNSKIEMNDAQVELAKGWLPSDSQPYAYNPKGMLWYWRLHYSGVPVKSSTKLNPEQVDQLNRLL